MNMKISVLFFFYFVKAIMYFFLYNLCDCTFKLYINLQVKEFDLSGLIPDFSKCDVSVLGERNVRI